MQLDAAENNGGIELGAVDKAHGSFIRRSTLLFVAGGARPTKWLTDSHLATSPACLPRPYCT